VRLGEGIPTVTDSLSNFLPLLFLRTLRLCVGCCFSLPHRKGLPAVSSIRTITAMLTAAAAMT
jgi:hypothetical protein